MLRTALLPLMVTTTLLVSGCVNWPGRPGAKATLGESRQERRSAAVQAFEEQRDRAELEAADDRWNQGDVAGCEGRLRAILARRPDDVEAHVRLAELAWANEDHAQAEAEYHAALRLPPERADVEHALGLVLQATGAPPRPGRISPGPASLSPRMSCFASDRVVWHARCRTNGRNQRVNSRQ